MAPDTQPKPDGLAAREDRAIVFPALVAALFAGNKLVTSSILIKLGALTDKMVSQKAGPKQTAHDRFRSIRHLHFDETICYAETHQPDVGKMVTDGQSITECLLTARIAETMRQPRTSVAHRPRLQASLRTNTIATPKSSSPKLKSNEADRRAYTRKAEAVEVSCLKRFNSTANIGHLCAIPKSGLQAPFSNSGHAAMVHSHVEPISASPLVTA